ncbi:hypothetical protein CN206_15340 [Sinorhizobium meliloti]|uniref:HNH endonuclease n=2 Tax=Rhizobium meliloti TaxID=382 RepID=UPI0009B6C781|nr:hypothetical protein CN206_15340 [Sinorhizobium meliloti]
MANPRVCSIPDCDKKTFHRGWCAGHYHRWRRYGDPQAGRPFMAGKFPSCAIEGCDKKRYAGGYCTSHYKRLKRHGDPMAGAAPHGEAMRFIHDVAIKYEGSECLLWPFGTIAEREYGAITVDREQDRAHRYICEFVNGPSPEPDYDAAHGCGNRACVNPAHLSWKTRADNMGDKLIHGTHHRGERCPTVRLTGDQVRRIRSLKGVKTQLELAREYGVARQTITNIQTGARWSWLT